MPHRSRITIAIIDDNRLVREALAAMLGHLKELTVVASHSADAAFLAETKPNVILLDVGLGEQDSLRVAAGLRDQAPDAKVIVMDLIPVSEEIAEFVNAGV